MKEPEKEEAIGTPGELQLLIQPTDRRQALFATGRHGTGESLVQHHTGTILQYHSPRTGWGAATEPGAGRTRDGFYTLAWPDRVTRFQVPQDIVNLGPDAAADFQVRNEPAGHPVFRRRQERSISKKTPKWVIPNGFGSVFADEINNANQIFVFQTCQPKPRGWKQSPMVDFPFDSGCILPLRTG